MSTQQPADTALTRLRVTDPDRIRALAHPVRMDLLGLVDELGEATATQCAERLGETVANCSFHLRTLAKAGFVEPAPARGREKPWRATSRGRVMEPDPANPASFVAVAEVAGLTMLHEVDRVRDFLQHHTAPEPEWDDTVTITSSTFWATADEMRDLVQRLNALTEPFVDRTRDASLRPPGARRGRLFATVNPDDPAPEPSHTQEG